MKSFRTPRYLERYEDVVFELENQLRIDTPHTQHQNRDGLKIVADNSGETTPDLIGIMQDSLLILKLINLLIQQILVLMIILVLSMDQIV